MSVRVSPTEKIRGEIDALFDGSRELSEIIEDVARLGARLIIQTAMEAEVEILGAKAGLPFTGTDLAMAITRLESSFKVHTPPAEYFTAQAGGRTYRVFFAQVQGPPADSEIMFYSIEALEARTGVDGRRR